MLCQETIDFCIEWLKKSNSHYTRHDYYELVQLTVLFLGGTFPENISFNFKSPGASHHARWMAKVLYTIKLALFKHQMKHVIPEDMLQKITDLAGFLCLFYVKE